MQKKSSVVWFFRKGVGCFVLVPILVLGFLVAPQNFGETTEEKITQIRAPEAGVSADQVAAEGAKLAQTPSQKFTQVAPSVKNYDYIVIGGREVRLRVVGSYDGAVNDNEVAFYAGQFLYGHNTQAAFGGLGSVSSFSIFSGGVEQKYAIVFKGVYCDYTNEVQHGISCGDEKKLLARAWGDPGNYFEPHAFGYDMSLMTCAGASLPGRDATYRLLAFAVRI